MARAKFIYLVQDTYDVDQPFVSAHTVKWEAFAYMQRNANPRHTYKIFRTPDNGSFNLVEVKE